MQANSTQNLPKVTVIDGPYKTWKGVVLTTSKQANATMLYVSIADPVDVSHGIQTWLPQNVCKVEPVTGAKA